MSWYNEARPLRNRLRINIWTLNNPIRRTKPEKTGLNAPLGGLEQAVMRHVWDSGESGVLAVEVHEGIDRERPIAITTVLTTLDRLRDKGILRREREGKAYRYWAAITEEELQRRIVGCVLDRLIAQFPKAVAAYFAQQPQGQTAKDKSTLSALAARLEDLNLEDLNYDSDGGKEHGH